MLTVDLGQLALLHPCPRFFQKNSSTPLPSCVTFSSCNVVTQRCCVLRRQPYHLSLSNPLSQHYTDCQVSRENPGNTCILWNLHIVLHRSPIWSVPGFSEGHLNMGVSPLLSTSDIPPVGQVTGGSLYAVTCPLCSLILQVITIPTASPEAPLDDRGVMERVGMSIQQLPMGIPTGSRTVLAKPLHPNQTLPPSIRTNLVSMGNPSPVTCKFTEAQ